MEAVSIPRINADRRGIFVARTVERRELCREHFRVTLAVEGFPSAEPGQFVQVLCREFGSDEGMSPDSDSTNSVGAHRSTPSQLTPMLRRPFSIGGLRRSANACEIDLIGRVIGAGTAWLDRLRVGDAVNILGPLGRPFSMPDASETALLVAGGVGLPPLLWLSLRLAEMNVPRVFFFSARSRELIPMRMLQEPDAKGASTLCCDELAQSGTHCAVTTDDGSCGMKGTITHALLRHLSCGSDPARLVAYSCGPEPMLRAVAKICAGLAIRCELALERVMGCGMGTCQSCVVPVRDPACDGGWRYALCCTEGPVFDARRVMFE